MAHRLLKRFRQGKPVRLVDVRREVEEHLFEPEKAARKARKELRHWLRQEATVLSAPKATKVAKAVRRWRKLERVTGVEPAAPSLEGWCSTR